MVNASPRAYLGGSSINNGYKENTPDGVPFLIFFTEYLAYHC